MRPFGDVRESFAQKLKWAFRMYETDHDGSITKNEVYLMIKVGINHMHFVFFGEKKGEEELMFCQKEIMAEWTGITFHVDNDVITIAFNNCFVAVAVEKALLDGFCFLTNSDKQSIYEAIPSDLSRMLKLGCTDTSRPLFYI